MPTTANTITYYVAADGTLRDGPQGSIAQTPRINYGTEYAVTLSFPPSTIAEGDQLQVALNRTRTFFSSASATGDAPVAAVVKHDVTAEEAAAQEVAVVLSTNTRAMIDQVNGIDHPVRGFFGVHVLRGQSFVTLAVADALMMSLESGPDAISPSLPVVDYPTREEAVALVERSEVAAGRAETAQGKAEEAQGKAETAEGNAQIWAEGTDQQVEELGGEHSAKGYNRLAGVSATNAEQSATNAGQSATDAGNAKTAAQTAQGKAEDAQEAAETAQGAAVSAKDAAQTAQANAEKIAEGSDADVAPLGLEHSAKGWAQEAAATLASKRDILQTLVTSSSTSLEVKAGKSYNWTVSAASTIALAAADKVANKETRIDIYIDLQSGGSVTGDGVTVADAVLQSGWYKLIWDGTNATLYSTKAGGAASVITIPPSSTAYTLQDNKHYQQVPSAVPTYTLPTASFDGLVHEITVLVDFLHVTSCSFVDAGGVPVTLQSAISPQIGEAYIFRCYWYGKWRVVPLKIRNAATVSSATGVVEVSDAVAGDALALNMVAPRSVVVNQCMNWSANVTAISGSTYMTISKDTTNQTLGMEVLIPTTANGLRVGVPLPRQHILAVHGIVTASSYGFTSQIGVASRGTVAQKYISQSNNTLFGKISINNDADTSNLFIYASFLQAQPAGWTYSIKDLAVVDLTQYFNGDSALIDSITSWDDLVAYDSTFASYVQYNTGTVTGVQPTVRVTGKNLLNINRPVGTLTSGVNPTSRSELSDDYVYLGLTFGNYYYPNRVASYTIGTDSCSGVTGSPANCGLSYPVKVKANTQYTISCLSLNGKVRMSFYASNGAYITTNDISIPAYATYKTFTTPVDCSIVLVTMYSSEVNTAWEVVKPQLELGSTATSYEPYHDGGTTQAPAPLFAVGNAADEFEAVSGVTTEAVGKVNLGTLNWSRSASGLYSAVIADSVTGTTISSAPYLCTKLNTVASVTAQSPDWSGKIGTNSTLYVAYSGTLDVDIFKGLVNGSYLYYQRTTPTTSQSTPTQISLQAGSNVAMQTDGGRTLAELAMTYENMPTGN